MLHRVKSLEFDECMSCAELHVADADLQVAMILPIWILHLLDFASIPTIEWLMTG